MRKDRQTSIVTKTSLVIGISIALIFSIITVYTYIYTYNSTLTEIKRNVLSKTAEASLNISNIFDITSQVAKQASLDNNIRTYLKEVRNKSQIQNHRYYKVVDKTLKNYNDSYENLLFLWMGNDKASFFIDNFSTVSKPNWDFSSRPWYLQSTKTKSIFFTAPYTTGEGDSEVMVLSAVQPVYENDEYLGVISADVSLSNIPKVMDSLKIGDKGLNFLFTSDGTLVYTQNMSDKDEELNIDSEAYKHLKEVYKLSTGEVLEVESNGQKYLAAYQNIPANDWGVISLVNKDEALYAVNRGSLILIVSLVVLALLLVLFVYFYIKITINPLKSLVVQTNKLSSGDLRTKIEKKNLTRKDEIGELTRSFDKMSSNISSLIKNIINASGLLYSSSADLENKTQNISSISDEIANTVSELAKGAMNQAEDTESGVSKTVDMARIIERNNKLNSHLSETVENIKINANEGKSVLNELVKHTNENECISKEIFDIVKTTEENSKNIDIASDMIASIADQTNLLALNAAIEAARAGDAGKGFSVVAEEIRKLAEDSTESTKNIHDIVVTLIENASYAVTKMNEAGEVVERQKQSVIDTEIKFTDILNAIDSAENSVKEVLLSSTEIENKKEEIISILESLAAIAEENAASTQEVSASTEEASAQLHEISSESEKLVEISDNLKEEISKFKI